MQDAFQYFTRMAHLVAEDSAPTPTHPDGRALAKLIRVVRPRRQVTTVDATPSVEAINDAASSEAGQKVKQAA
jgi:hypothetical protein